MVTVQDLLPISGDGINVLPTALMAILAILAYLVIITRRPSGYPPGPPFVPLLGSIPFLKHGGAEYYKEFTLLSRTYGDIFSIALGHTWIVVINGYDTIKEALVTKGTDFAGRIDDPRLDLLYKDPNKRGIIDGDLTPEWSKQRNASLNILRSLGWGKLGIEEKMAEERDTLVEIFKKSANKPYNPASSINTSVINIICSMLFGERFVHGDDRLTTIIESVNVFIATASMDFEWDYVPFLTKLIPGVSKIRDQIKKASDVLQDFIESEINLRKQSLEQKPDDEPTDFIECYLKELSASADAKKLKMTENWLLEIAQDFFIAGSETTTTTLKWALIYMLHYPEVAAKVQEEMDSVMGRPTGHGATALADRARLPYTDATIMEIQRLSSIVATALVHCTTKDVSIKGYRLPKGTQVRYNVHAVHHDPNYWTDPKKMKPERFLDEEGEICKDERWIPFGMGRRNCLGEQLAKQELFMFFTGIIHNFNIRLPEGATLPSLEPAVPGVILIPPQYEVIFEPRF